MENAKKNNNIVIEIDDLKKWFPISKGLSRIFSSDETFLKAVDGISLTVGKGEIVTLVGESGCGKTTTGRTILKLTDPTSGTIKFNGIDLTSLNNKKIKEFRKKIQMVFQNPFDSVNPRMKVYDILKEPLRIHNITEDEEKIKNNIYDILGLVKLTPPEQYVMKYPSGLSGGELQRVCIARSLILQPEFIVADEPVSMLDMSVRAGILNFFIELRNNYGTSILFITHDLAMASYVGDRMIVMYMGKIFEEGPIESIISNPLNPYTQALMASVPHPDPTREPRRVSLKGEPSSPVNLPLGCRFHPRCLHAMDSCREKEPTLFEIENGHRVACFLYNKET